MFFDWPTYREMEQGINAPQSLSALRGGPTMNVNGGFWDLNGFSFDGGYFVNPPPAVP